MEGDGRRWNGIESADGGVRLVIVLVMTVNTLLLFMLLPNRFELEDEARR